jgi:hypothetical protein
MNDYEWSNGGARWPSGFWEGNGVRTYRTVVVFVKLIYINEKTGKNAANGSGAIVSTPGGASASPTRKQRQKDEGGAGVCRRRLGVRIERDSRAFRIVARSALS